MLPDRNQDARVAPMTICRKICVRQGECRSGGQGILKWMVKVRTSAALRVYRYISMDRDPALQNLPSDADRGEEEGYRAALVRIATHQSMSWPPRAQTPPLPHAKPSWMQSEGPGHGLGTACALPDDGSLATPRRPGAATNVVVFVLFAVKAGDVSGV